MIGGGDDVLIDSTFTDENGFYLFGGLSVDDGDGNATYKVVVAPDNFDPQMVLEGLVNSYDPNDMVTNPDIMSGVVTLQPDAGGDENGDLDQDFGYTGNPMDILGSIGNKVWEDTDADGIFEPDGADGIPGTDDDEIPIEGITLDLYRDLDGNGQVDPGEPLVGSATTDANGMYLFDNLPLDDYVVDVTDEDGILNGYWHSLGNQDASTNGGNDPMDNSKEDPFAVTIDMTTPDNLNVDFGYYVQPAAVGNYVWEDSNANGLQDDGETGINDVVVTLMITYPDGTMLTIYDTTRNDAAGNPGFYDFRNLLLDEDYNGFDNNNTGDVEPEFVIKINTASQDGTGEPLNGFVPTTTNAGTDDMLDSDQVSGVTAEPIQGSQDTEAKDPTDTEMNPIAGYDFGFTATELVGIGGTVWEDQGDGGGTQNDGTQDGGELGIAGVKVQLLDDTGMILDSTKTNSDGTYLFEGLQPDIYQVKIPVCNYEMGGPLQSLPFSSVPTETMNDNDTDNDDNGAQATANGMVTSPFYTLSVGGEPSGTDEILTPGQDGTDGTKRDVNTNTTVDFGFQDEILPVELLGFRAQADKDHIDLFWSTASELNNSHFDLERSENGKDFKAIARIQGQGTTLEQHDYSYEDDKAIPGVLYYYRLKQVDIDGQFEYSEIRTAQLEAVEHDMTLYPNPIGQESMLQVRFYAEDISSHFMVMDIHSRVVLEVKEDLNASGWNTIQIDISSLADGTYILLDKKGNAQRFAKVAE